MDGAGKTPDAACPYFDSFDSSNGYASSVLSGAASGDYAGNRGWANAAKYPGSPLGYWTFNECAGPFVHDGIVNLTKDDAPALPHFSDGQTQQWLMVRLEEPKDTEGSQ